MPAAAGLGRLALSAPRLELRARAAPAGVELRLEVPARVETWIDLDVVSAGRSRRVFSRVIPRSRWAFWNPRWRRESFRVDLGEALAGASGEIVVRASAQPGSVWLWQQPPVVRELRFRAAAEPLGGL